MMTQPRERSSWGRRFGRLTVRQIDLALAVLVTVAGVVLLLAGLREDTRSGFLFLQNVELRTLDFRFTVRGARPHDDRIVIVDIDERTLLKLGSYPIPRGAYAQLVDRLHAGGAAVVAFDATFPTAANNSALAALDSLQKDSAVFSSVILRKKIEEARAASDQDAIFAAAIKNAGNVVLGHVFLDAERAKLSDPKLEDAYYDIVWGKSYPQVVPVKTKGQQFDLNQAFLDAGGTFGLGVDANIPRLADAAADYGFININTDPDGTLRHADLIIRYRDKDFFPPLDLEALRVAEKIPDQDIVVYIAENGVERIQFGKRTLLPSRNGRALINYTGPYGSYKHVPMVDVITGEAPAEDFRDKIVLVGATAQAIGDLRNTPFQTSSTTYMGVEVHANIIDNLLHNDEPGRTFLHRGLREEYTDLGFILLFGLVFGVWFSRTKPLYSTISALLALAAFSWFVYFRFASGGSWLSFVVPAGTLVANYAAITSFRMVFEEREKRKIRKTFGQYLSPGVIALIDRDPEKYIRPGGELKELTVMFTDIRGFTSLSEGMPPNELVEWLNEYLSAMTDVLFANFGTLDKYIGDAIMAFWGSPYPQKDHAISACRCGLAMMRKLEELNRKWEKEGKRPAAMGVGVNTGPVNVGNMGSNKRLSWTVMGDNVNLASRLEGLTKKYKIRMVISEATYKLVAEHFVCRDLDRILVSGKRQPVDIYELLGAADEREKFADQLQRFDQAMKLYRGQNWKLAAEEFTALLTAYPEDGPAQIFLQRSLEFIDTPPPADWDGVYEMKSK